MFRSTKEVWLYSGYSSLTSSVGVLGGSGLVAGDGVEQVSVGLSQVNSLRVVFPAMRDDLSTSCIRLVPELQVCSRLGAVT